MTKQSINTIAISTLVVATYFVTQALVQHIDGTQQVQSNLDAVVLNCLPRATNEQTVMRLSQQGEALALQCEKHRTVGYGQGVKPAVKYVVAVRD